MLALIYQHQPDPSWDISEPALNTLPWRMVNICSDYIFHYMCNLNIYMAISQICSDYMVVSQNCVWNVPRCSGRMERRGFVTVLVPDLWSVMKYKLYIYMYINIYIYTYCKYVCNIHLRDMLVEATLAGCRSFSLLICTYLHDMYTCSTQVCLAWLVLVQ